MSEEEMTAERVEGGKRRAVRGRVRSTVGYLVVVVVVIRSSDAAIGPRREAVARAMHGPGLVGPRTTL